MEYTLKKKFRFEAAHRLAKGYVGKCSNIHGHSWNGELEVTTNKVDDKGLAVDFSVLKGFLKMIEERFDHKLILWEGDAPFVMAMDGMTDVETVYANPTSETLAQLIYREFAWWVESHQEYGIISFKVHIAETCTCCCTYTESKA